MRQFEEIAELKNNVEAWDGGGPAGPGLAGRLALFERSQILRATAEQVAGGLPSPSRATAAAAASPEPPGEAWVAELAPEARQALELLTPEQQAGVQQLLRELGDQPEQGAPLDAPGGEDGKGGQAPDLRWYSPEHQKDFVLVYALQPRLRRIHVLQLRILAVSSRPVNLFFSYSHADVEWFARLRNELAPLETFDIHFWTDTTIEPGQSWFEAIGKGMADAQGAFILLSANYLRSDFIRRYELPLFLERVETSPDDFVLLWVPLAPVEGIGEDELGQRILSKQGLGDPKTADPDSGPGPAGRAPPPAGPDPPHDLSKVPAPAPELKAAIRGAAGSACGNGPAAGRQGSRPPAPSNVAAAAAATAARSSGPPFSLRARGGAAALV